MTSARAKVFWSGRSQAVRLPREFRFDGTEVLIRRKGSAVVLEPCNDWPEGYAESFGPLSKDFKRPAQGRHERRAKLK